VAFLNSLNRPMEFKRKLFSLIAGAAMTSAALADQPALLKSEFIYETAPFPEAHASTIVETRTGLVAAWFGGTRERNPDVGIWLARLEHGA